MCYDNSQCFSSPHPFYVPRTPYVCCATAAFTRRKALERVSIVTVSIKTTYIRCIKVCKVIAPSFQFHGCRPTLDRYIGTDIHTEK